MPLINYKETMSFPDAVEAAVILLALCLVNLRDEAAHREDEDPATLTAAHFFIDLLEDTLKESEALANTLELSFIDYLQRRNKAHLFFYVIANECEAIQLKSQIKAQSKYRVSKTKISWIASLSLAMTEPVHSH